MLFWPIKQHFFFFCLVFRSICIIFAVAFRSNRGVAQLVALLVWDQAVARSSRVAPTKKTELQHRDSVFFCFMKIQNPILRLALPSVVTNITVPLLGLVDATIVGHMGRAEYIGAIAIGTTIFNMVYWIFGFLRMGTTGIVSQAHGAGDDQAIRDGLLRSLLLGLFISLCLLLLQTPLLRFAMWLMQPEKEVATYATEYFRVCIWGAPAMMASYSLTGWFIGMQDTRTPMRMAILQNLVNILLTTIFVFLLHMGVAGVALGTVLGLYTGIAATPLLSHRGGRRILGILQAKQNAVRSGKSLFTLHFSLFLRTLCLVAVTVYFTSAGSRLGSIYLDANALLMQFFIVFSYFTDGLANAAEAFSGEYTGRGDRVGLRSVIRSLFLWGLGLAIVFTLFYAAAGSWILSLLTNQQAVLTTARDYLPWLVAVPFVSFAAFVWDGVYIGMTMARRMFLAMFIAAIVFFAVWFLFGPTNHILWLAFLSYLATRSLAQTLFFPR